MLCPNAHKYTWLQVFKRLFQLAIERHAAMTWAQRLKRVFGIDVESCVRCGKSVKVIACIEGAGTGRTDPGACERERRMQHGIALPAVDGAARECVSGAHGQRASGGAEGCCDRGSAGGGAAPRCGVEGTGGLLGLRGTLRVSGMNRQAGEILGLESSLELESSPKPEGAGPGSAGLGLGGLYPSYAFTANRKQG